MRVSETVKRRLTLLTGASLVAILVVAGTLLISTLAKAQGSVNIVGTVTNQSGTGIQNVEVMATAPDDSTVLYGPATTDTSGAYDLGIDPGTYDIHFTPSSGFNPFTVEDFVVDSNGEALDVQLVPNPQTLSGKITDSNGNPVPGISITLHDPNAGMQVGADTTDVSGNYSITALAGSYSMYGSYNNANPPAGVPSQFRFYNDFFPDLTNGDVTKDIQLPAVATVTAVAKDDSNNPVSNAPVKFDNWIGPSLGDGFTLYWPSSTNGTTDASGNFAKTVFEGSSFAAGKICVTFSQGQVCNASTVAASSGGTQVELIAPATHTLSGTITDTEGNPIPSIPITVHDPNAGVQVGTGSTDANGDYSIIVPAGGPYSMQGTYNVADPPASLPSPFRFNVASLDLISSDATKDIQLPAPSVVTVVAKDSNNSPVSGANVTLENWSGPTFGGGVEVYWPGEVTGTTDASGSFSRTVFEGSTFTTNEICVDLPQGQLCNANTVTAAVGGTTVELVAPNNHTISGTVTDSNSAPVASLSIKVYDPHGGATIGTDTTDANGHYSITGLAGGPYSMQGIYENINSPAASLPPSFRFGINNLPDLTNGDATKDIQLPATSVVTVVAKDPSGNPISNIPASIEDWTGPTTAGMELYSPFDTNGTTDASGGFSRTVFVGSYFTANEICIQFTEGQTCNASTVTAGSGGTTLIFQQVPPTPVAPANLSTDTPTNQSPNLSWSAVTGAVEYRIFRDGNQVGTSTTTSFVDSDLAASGSYSYTVAAVNSSNVAGPTSEPFVVVYDIDNPTITYALDPAANANSWNNSDVTVTFTCNDTLSGVASCSEPVTVSGETAGEEVTGTVTDEAGNTATATATVKLDKTAPVVNYELNTAPNANGWHNGDVTVTFTCDDALSGIESCSEPVTVQSEGAGQVITGTAIDKAGNTISVNVTLNIDKTGPTITYTVNPPPNTAGWNNGDVTVTFDCQDSVSGVASCTDPATVTTEGDNNQAAGNAVDLAGNAADVTATVKLDKTDPTIGTPTMSGVVLGILLGSTTNISATVGDNLSGVVRAEYYFDTDPGQGSGTAMSLSANPTNNGTASATANVSGLGGGQHTLYVRSQDASGNWSTVATRTFVRLL